MVTSEEFPLLIASVPVPRQIGTIGVTILSEGLSEAVQIVRAARPGAIQTVEQEQYVRHLKRTGSASQIQRG